MSGRVIKKRRLDERFIAITNGITTKKIGVDGDREAIDSTIRSVFHLSKDRVFWLEDEDGCVAIGLSHASDQLHSSR